MSTRRRLDQLLVENGHYASRARARDAILRGAVRVNGRTAAKPGQTVSHDISIEISDSAQCYVSRAALKLKHVLDHFDVVVTGLHALDIGASTGGFTQVLLERGATSVHAIDVGHDQLADSLKNDTRVVSLEGLNARELNADHISHPVGIITCDVSFISLKLALPPALAMAGSGAILIALIKPQFELERRQLGKKGVVRDQEHLHAVCKEIAGWLEREQDWRVIGVAESPIVGGDGNHEFLIVARKP